MLDEKAVSLNCLKVIQLLGFCFLVYKKTEIYVLYHSITTELHSCPELQTQVKE